MKTLSRIYLGIIIFFCYAPIFSLIFFSFNESKSLTQFEGFSLRWYNELSRDREFVKAIIMTIFVAIVATIVATIIGTLAAIALSKSKRAVKELIMYFTNLPIVNPEIVTAVALMMFFVSIKVNLGYVTMIIAHISFCIPYVLITVYPRVKELDPNTVEAALDLGATPVQALRKVIFPQLTTAIFAGASIAFTMSFDDFVISYFTAGSATNISIYLYGAAKRMTPIANAFSTILIICIAAFISIRYFFSRKSKEWEEE